jgi:two-component system, response regulator PdtaR
VDERTRGTDAGGALAIRVLIVDDTDHVRQMLANMLELDGFDVAGQAASGQAAIDFVRESVPDIVIMDFKMPIMDGLVATEHIRAIAPTVPVILYTAYLDEDMQDRARAAGVSACIGKVEGLSSLEREISALCLDLVEH